MNALEWNRDLRWTVPEIRESERGMTDRPDREHGTVSLGEMRRGRVGMCVATMIARHVKRGSAIPGWHSQEQAWAQTQGQLAWYHAMEEAGEMAHISDAAALERHLEHWNAVEAAGGDAHAPIGYVLSLEGADSILTPHHLERAYAQGLRAVGPAHYGPGVYAQGTNASGGIGEHGRALLARDGAAEHHPRRDAPLRRELLGEPRAVPGAGVGEPQQLPGAGPARPAVLGRAAEGDHRARRRHWRRVRRVDAGARLGAGIVDAAEQGRDAGAGRRPHRSHLPGGRQRAATPASDRISTARSAPNRARRMSTRSRTFRNCPRCWPRAAIRRRISRTSAAATSCAVSGRPGVEHACIPPAVPCRDRRGRRFGGRAAWRIAASLQGDSRHQAPDEPRVPGSAGQRVCGRRLQRSRHDGR